MAKVTFKSYNPNDNLLLPPCLGDYLPENHNARVVSAIIDRLDISEIERRYKGGGASSYNPRMLLKVIVYAYLNNIYSGRRMERLLVENIAFMWLSGMQRPETKKCAHQSASAGELCLCRRKQTKNPAEMTGMRYKNVTLMSPTQKTDGTSRCFAQIGNIKRQSLF